MCDPITMLIVGTAVSAGGSLASGLAGFGSHNASAKLAEGNADLLRTQSRIAGVNADIATTRGNYDELLTQRKVDHVLAQELTHFSSGNIDATWGSPLLLQGFSAAQGQVDRELIRARMMSERADALTQAANISGQATAQQFRAASERGAAWTSLVKGVTGAATAFLGAGTKWPSLSAPNAAGGMFSADYVNNPFLLNQPTDI